MPRARKLFEFFQLVLCVLWLGTLQDNYVKEIGLEYAPRYNVGNCFQFAFKTNNTSLG